MMNRENLKKLADYLLSEEVTAEFDMRFYTQLDRSYGTNSNCLIECGSVGCAVGHGPYAGIPKSSQESWTRYADRVFGEEEEVFLWCFSPDWHKVDNTAVGAGLRILYMLENGIPENAFAQSIGRDTLCYK